MNMSFQNSVRHNLAGNEPYLLSQIIFLKKFPQLQHSAYYSNHLTFKYDLHQQ